MDDKKIIIIGAGIAGLVTGCYAVENGFPVEIYEMHDKPGGMCTSWQRKDFTFDYCIHNLAGTSPKSGLYKVWQELGAISGSDVVNHDEFVSVDTTSGQTLHWYTDLERLEEHLKQIAPEDMAPINEFIGSARKLAKADLFSMPLGGIKRTIKALPRLALLKKWSQVTIGQFARRFSSPVIRKALPHVMYDIPGDQVPMLALLIFSGGMSERDLGWPFGGSLAFSKKIESHFLELGGKLFYKNRVEKIIVENNKATGIRLADGSEQRADYIISAADGYDTIYRMLEGKYLTEPIKNYYRDVGDSSPFGLIIFLGLDTELQDMPHALTILFDEPIDIGDIQQDSIHVVTYGADSGLVPAGKSIVKIEVQARYPYWKSRRDADVNAYREEKTRVAKIIIDRLATRVPDIGKHIEVMDVSTPPTAERYTGNRYGWQAGPPKENIEEIQRKGLSKTLPGLENFFHVGQWSMANLGVSSAAIMGRNLVKELCKRESRPFLS